VAAPVRVGFTHVHSIRLASGPEALAVRVLLEGGGEGYGFNLVTDPAPARDMAAWDAFARRRGLPLAEALGCRHRERVSIERDEQPALKPDWDETRRAMFERRYKLLRIDPFAWGSLEYVISIGAAAAALGTPVALLAPNAHPWELAYAVSVAAALPGDVKVIQRKVPETPVTEASRRPGLGIDWALEPAFASIGWQGL
jgi:L-alanine-DL-glutamate epimerase-like enolase superfamily enzyme